MGASLTCTARRYVELTSHPVVLVSSSNGIVEWPVASSKARNFGPKTGTPIHHYTSTYECVTEGDDRREWDRTEAECWYPERTLNSDFEIYEEVWNIPTYGYCLTLLWLPSL